MKILLLIKAGLFLASCGSQNIAADKVPSVVLNTVKTKYPVNDDVNWERHKENYEAEIDVNDSTETTLLIDGSGRLLKQKMDIRDTDLPGSVSSALTQRYPDHTIDDLEKLEIGGVYYYQLELNKKGSKELHVVFTTDGHEDKSVEYWD